MFEVTMKKLLLIIIFLSCNVIAVNKHSPPDLKYAGTEAAFDFSLDHEWFNTKEPISLLDLRGKIVLLHFWKYSSINSLHSLEELKRLETKWKKELVVIGIHTPKFSSEKNSESLKQAILRSEINHPIINDKDFSFSRQYNINSWPSFVLIDPNGKVFGVQEGEGVYEGFDKIIQEMYLEFKEKGFINLEPVSKIDKKENTKTNSKLLYPAKLIVDDKGTELFVSDTNNNRILRIDIQKNKIIEIIGKGSTGYKDGKFKEAKFHYPQGLALHKDELYIADSKNHSIRVANLKTKMIQTIAGTGEQARTINVPGRGTQVAFNSPWDITILNTNLYITMRGAHQIWILNLKSLEAEVFAGNGSENIFDGNLSLASLAQPTSITRDEIKIYFLDSEVSALRSIGIKSSQTVKTIIGKGLFEFGDIDGLSPKARLQFPMGICYNSGKLYIADTFNHKIKQLDLDKNEISTLAGNGKIGSVNGTLPDSSFFEPTGIAVYKNLIYVADTNNHLIRVIDLQTNTVSNFEFE